MNSQCFRHRGVNFELDYIYLYKICLSSWTPTVLGTRGVNFEIEYICEKFNKVQRDHQKMIDQFNQNFLDIYRPFKLTNIPDGAHK